MTLGLGRIGGLLACVGLVVAHGGVAHQKPLAVDPDADWGTRHMAGEIPSNCFTFDFEADVMYQLTNV